MEYTASSLASSGSPAPAVTITNSDLIGGLAFDAQGDLWVADFSVSEVLEFTPAQLAAGGTFTPTATLTANSGSISRPLGLALDTAGDLWVVNQTDSLVAFAPTQLAASGTTSPVPPVIISANSGSLNSPYGIAFDANGNLWVATSGGTVVRFDASQLTTENPVPSATLTLGGAPHGVAFDSNGALWVSDTTNGHILRFTNVSTLSGSVSPAPAITIAGVPGGDVYNNAFLPTPAGLPINTP